MSFKRVILSALAVAGIAATAGTASAQGRDQRSEHSRIDRGLFERQEAARREVQDSERRERSQRRLAKFEQEKRETIRDYGNKSAEYRWFVAKWESRWNAAVERERKLIVEQRMAARRRYEQQGLDPRRYAELDISPECIERELPRAGVMLFPRDQAPQLGHGYGHDHRNVPVDDRAYIPRELKREAPVVRRLDPPRVVR